VKPYPGPLPFQGSAGPSPRQAFTYSPPPSTYHSRFDTIYRLISEQKRNSQQQTLYTYAYSYDGVGNRETMTHNGAQTSYSYDNNNKLTQFVGPGGTTTFGYDGNGNTTSMTAPGPITTTYGYDYENRLTSATKPGYTAAYTYAADGLRLRAQESNNPNPDRWFQYDGVRPVLESILGSDGSLQTILAKYVWERNSYYDPLVFGYIGSAWRHPLYDGLGSTRQLINQTDQAVTDTYSYEAFGNLLSSTGTTPNPYRYVGSLGYYQTGSNLMHLGARYYMPEVGRFAGRDRARKQARYVYCGNRPVVAVDPDGRQEQEIGSQPGIELIGALIAALLAGISLASQPCPERKRHGRCKELWGNCKRWCQGYDWGDHFFWDPDMPFRDVWQCKDACDKARAECNKSGNENGFPHPH